LQVLNELLASSFRLRGEVGYELARDALREWLRRGGKPARLIETASRLPRAKSPIRLVPIQSHSLPAVLFSGLDGVKTPPLVRPAAYARGTSRSYCTSA